MAEYLDKTGLTYLWSKIKAKLDAKADKTALDAKADKTALDAKADKTALDAKADKTTADALGKRIDNLIVSSGNESSAEVIDARTGCDGTTYDTLGTAIRSQANKLNNDIESLSGKPLMYNFQWIENQYINGDTGAVVNYAGWKRSDYIQLQGDTFYITTNQTTDNEYNAYYDENKKYIGKIYITALSNKAKLVRPNNAKYAIVSCASNINIKVHRDFITISELEQKVNNLETDKLPDYYNDYLVKKNNTVNDIMNKINNCVSFIFITDQHIYSNKCNSGMMCQNVLANTSVKDVINGGDIISAYGTDLSIADDINKYRKYWGMLKAYFVRGNHEIYVKETEESTAGIIKPNSMLINSFIRPYHDDIVTEAGKTYYYFDRPQNNVRFIVIDTTEIIEASTNGKFEPVYSISQGQINWFINLLKNTPQNYKIVLCSHTPININVRWYLDKALIFGDIVEAFNNKQAINKTDKFGKKAIGDFTKSNGKIILSICGHGHVDYSYVSSSGCVYYEVNCDSLLNNGGSPYERVENTISEQSFDVVIIDADTGNIRTVRYGAGVDKTLITN